MSAVCTLHPRVRPGCVGMYCPHLMTFCSLVYPFISALFPVLLKDSSSSLFKKKKKSRPKINIWKFSTVVKSVSGVFRVFLSSLTEDKASFGKLSEAYETHIACWHVWLVLLSTLAFFPSWYPCLLHLFFPKVPLVFCSCLEDGLLTGRRFLHCRCHVFDFFTKLHTAFCELPNYIFFPE